LCADLDCAIAAHEARGRPKPDDIPARQSVRMKDPAVNLLHKLDQVDESELNESLASQLAEVRRHLESSLWGMAEQARRPEAEFEELVRQAGEIWGPP
jgi:hypothetical protein